MKHFFDEAFFFLAMVAMIMKNEKLTFSSFHSNHCKGRKNFYNNCAACQSKLPWKNGVKQTKDIQENCRKSVFSSSLLRTQTVIMVQNAAKITLFDFTTTCHIPEWIWFVEQFVWTFCA